MTDVLISGGGVAGSTLAILLGRRGLQVELFEHSNFPKEKPCGEGLMPAGVAVLNRLGVGEAVGGAPFYGVRYHFGKHVTEGRFPQTMGLPVSGRGQRRKHLDEVLFRTAADAPGVSAHTGTHVDGPLRENGRVVGMFVDKQGSLRASINELGKVLSALQVLAKKHHQSFTSVVEAAPINLPRRTAYRYVACFNAAKQSGVSALVENAGFDPASTRIIKRVKKLGIAKVRRMNSVQLAVKLEKGTKKQNPSTLFIRALKAYTKYLVHDGYDFREIHSRIERMIGNSVTPSLVRKAA